MDFDTVLFSAATICEKKYINVKHKSSNTTQRFENLSHFRGVGKLSRPDQFGSTYKNRTSGKREESWLMSLNKQRSSGGNLEQFKVGEFSITESPEQVNDIVAAKVAVNNMIEKLTMLPWVNRHKLRLVIGGCDKDSDYLPNFRMAVAKSFKYKGSRGRKPIVFYELREWFINKYKDYVVINQGSEADDSLVIFNSWCNETNHKCVLAYVDKDIQQAENSYWFNYDKLKNITPKELENPTNAIKRLTTPKFIDKYTANKSLYLQIIKGDMSCDNIPGLINCGNVAAEKILKDCVTEKDMADGVREAYRCYAEEATDKKTGETVDLFIENGYNNYESWRSVLNEQFMLLKLLENNGEVLTFDEYLIERGIAYE